MGAAPSSQTDSRKPRGRDVAGCLPRQLRCLPAQCENNNDTAVHVPHVRGCGGTEYCMRESTTHHPVCSPATYSSGALFRLTAATMWIKIESVGQSFDIGCVHSNNRHKGYCRNLSVCLSVCLSCLSFVHLSIGGIVQNEKVSRNRSSSHAKLIPGTHHLSPTGYRESHVPPPPRHAKAFYRQDSLGGPWPPTAPASTPPANRDSA